jgi:hypothetical protein
MSTEWVVATEPRTLTPESSGLVLIPVATDVDEVEHPADRIAGGGVGQFFLPLAEPLQRVERRDLRGPQEVELDLPFDVVVVTHTPSR